MDCSLDDYMPSKMTIRLGAKRNPKAIGRGAFQNTQKPRPHVGQAQVLVTGLGKVPNFDARQKIHPKVTDAREKIFQKSKFADADARIRIQSKKATEQVPDARMKLQRKQAVQDARSKIRPRNPSQVTFSERGRMIHDVAPAGVMVSGDNIMKVITQSSSAGRGGLINEPATRSSAPSVGRKGPGVAMGRSGITVSRSNIQQQANQPVRRGGMARGFPRAQTGQPPRRINSQKTFENPEIVYGSTDLRGQFVSNRRINTQEELWNEEQMRLTTTVNTGPQMQLEQQDSFAMMDQHQFTWQDEPQSLETYDMDDPDTMVSFVNDQYDPQDQYQSHDYYQPPRSAPVKVKVKRKAPRITPPSSRDGARTQSAGARLRLTSPTASNVMNRLQRFGESPRSLQTQQTQQKVDSREPVIRFVNDEYEAQTRNQYQPRAMPYQRSAPVKKTTVTRTSPGIMAPFSGGPLRMQSTVSGGPLRMQSTDTRTRLISPTSNVMTRLQSPVHTVETGYEQQNPMDAWDPYMNVKPETYDDPPQRITVKTTQPKVTRVTQPSSDVMSRLQKPVEKKVPVGDFVSPLQGYKVLVTNLHGVVTQEDIVELFGAMGALKKARLLKQGTAEVVFVRREDAVNAIKKYHLRELDGQPMHLVMASAQATAPKPAAAAMKDVRNPLRIEKAPVATAVKPGALLDAGMVHKALFKTAAKEETPSRPVTFTVKI